MRVLLLALIAACYSVVSFGQNLKDTTIVIDAIEFNERGSGEHSLDIPSRNSMISNAVLDQNRTQSLSELLSKNSLVNVKSLGQGGLATSSFRGTSSNHTQVNWNGIQINSPMMCNFDLSQVPVFFADRVMLYHGGSYMKSGTGALGGSINLDNTYDSRFRDTSIKLLSEYGSNSTFSEAISARFSAGKLTSNTRLFYQQSQNNYRYLNKVLSMDAFYERRANAQYKMAGIMQQLYYDLPRGALLTANVWYQWDDKSLPQPITIYDVKHERQRSGSLRSLVSYSKDSGISNYAFTVVYLRDDQLYQRRFNNGPGDTDSKNVSHSVVAKMDYEHFFADKLEVNGSLSYRYDRVISDNYNNSHAQRNIVSANISALWQPIKKLIFNAKILGEVNDGRCVPTYSVGASYAIVENLLYIKASNTFNYRFPSLNDLYWTPGGNIDLKPERGFSYDATIGFTPKLGCAKFNFEGTYYRMDIKDWIMWIPLTNSYIWQPMNFSRVFSQGVELSGEVAAKTGDFYHKLMANYAYSSSVDNSQPGVHGKQLPYIPLNRCNARYAVTWRGVTLNYNVGFTDVRYITTDQSYSTDAYVIHDANVDYLLKLGRRCKLKFSLRVDNIFNAYYESTQYYPMPLRSVLGGVQLEF